MCIPCSIVRIWLPKILAGNGQTLITTVYPAAYIVDPLSTCATFLIYKFIIPFPPSYSSPNPIPLSSGITRISPQPSSLSFLYPSSLPLQLRPPIPYLSRSDHTHPPVSHPPTPLPLPPPSAQPSPTPRNPVRTPSPAPYPAAPALRALWTPIPSSRADPSRLAVGDPPAFAAAVQTLPRRVWPSRAPRAAAWFLESLPLLLLRWGVQRSGGGGARGR